MPRNKLVIAVIPAYKAANTLPALLDELIMQKYDDIFVLDDASTDDTVKIAKSYGAKVNLIENRENVGSGANRNRIIGQTDRAILHFIDADMQLLSKGTPKIIRSLKWEEDTAYYGGMVRNPDGSQNPFNFGPRASVVTGFTSLIQFIVWLVGMRFETAAGRLRSLLNPVLKSWPNIYKPAKPCRAFWTAESNIVIRSETYTSLGGYDPIFRYGEANDFGLKLHHLGLKAYFEPRIDVLHNSLDNIFKRRKEKRIASRQYRAKHGHLIVLVPRLGDYLTGLKTQKRYHK